MKSRESPFSPFLRNIIQLVKDLKSKMPHAQGSPKDKILLLIAQNAQRMLTKEDVTQVSLKDGIMLKVYFLNHNDQKAELTGLLKLFEEYFAEPKGSAFSDKSKKAPFCALGDDCFEDVDHQKLTMEIKRMALGLAGYLKTRMVDEVRKVT